MSSAIGAGDVAHWQGWIGREEVREQRLDAESLRRFAAATGESLEVERAPPALAHWAWFLPVAAASEIGEDGHPRRGGFLPPVSLSRRMFAASSMRFPAPLRLDDVATLTSTIAEVKHRSGRSGDLVFVEVERRIVQAGEVRVEERQTIVYRDAGGTQPAIAQVPDAGAAQAWLPGPVDLFRFSAVTFNAHRIHYDRPYATGVEGYPDLVVHGPFTAAKLFAHARDRAGRTPTAFSFRAQAPLFVSQPVRLVAGDAEGEYRALRCDGEVAMAATAAF
ncbi:MAG TPA: MaoC family dehydratase N-terminal domain-containing protein [Xanthomonadaceae bacterium]|nr:MaoC family dehydratase N-terminal domain-containing protein [Luteimonas sp.]HRQ64203.1 MaoC family dehydratase N-terminal domain-containing protein [Xanthomonadaceae bacterium]